MKKEDLKRIGFGRKRLDEKESEKKNSWLKRIRRKTVRQNIVAKEGRSRKIDFCKRKVWDK